MHDDGTEYLSNSSESNVLFTSVDNQNADELPLLGRPFLSSTLLYVDNEHDQFTLWQSAQSITPNLMTIGTPICSASPSANNATQPPSSSHESSTPAGAIAGGIIGALAFVTILVAIALFLLRRRRNNRRATEDVKSNLDRPEMQGDYHKTEVHGNAYKAEMQGEQNYPYAPEMSVDDHQLYELPLQQNSDRKVTAELPTATMK